MDVTTAITERLQSILGQNAFGGVGFSIRMWEFLAHRYDVQPLVRRPRHAPVVKVETVDVDDGIHGPDLVAKSRGRPEGRPRTLSPRGQGGY